MVRATHPHPRKPASARSRFALVNWRVRWRLAAVIAVPTLTAAVLGALTIYGDVSNWQATGRVLHLAQLNADTIKLSQALEDELNVSAAYAATEANDADAGRPRSSRRRTPPTAPPTRSSATPRASPTGGRVPARHRAGPQRGAGEHQRPGERPQGRHRHAVPRVGGRPGLQREPHHPREHVQRRHRHRRQRRRPCRATSPRWAPCCGTRTRCRCSGPFSTLRSSPRRGHCAQRISPTCSRLPSRRRRTWLTSTPPATRPNSSTTATRSAAIR